jgi:hypothetical protein
LSWGSAELDRQLRPPLALYGDNASHLVANRGPLTQIGRALLELDIVWIAAHSPQVKGRVESSFRTPLDRRGRRLPLVGISDTAKANDFREGCVQQVTNRRFVVAPACAPSSAIGSHAPSPATTVCRAIYRATRSPATPFVPRWW